jgi:GT2 family glycosyltransferase
MEKPSKLGDCYDLSIIIVSFNTKDILRRCLEHLNQSEGDLLLEIIVVDNASLDGSVEMLADEYPQVRVISSEINLGFAGANNRALREATGDFYVLLNSDAFLRPDALRLALEHMRKNPDVGLAGGLLIGPDESRQPSARMFPNIVNDLFTMSGLSTKFPTSRLFGRADRTWYDPQLSAEVDWVPGAFAILNPAVLQKVGLFDEQFFLYYEEVDLCRRIKSLGYKVMYWPDILVVHLGGESSKKIPEAMMSKAGSQLTLWRMRSELLYYRKHHRALSAFMAYKLECVWNTLRRLRNSLRSDSESVAKARESMAIIQLKNRAWKETRGGRISPPRPW